MVDIHTARCEADQNCFDNGDHYKLWRRNSLIWPLRASCQCVTVKLTCCASNEPLHAVVLAQEICT